MSLLASWGFGGELVFNVGDAIANMRRASGGTRNLRVDFDRLKAGAQTFAGGVGQVALALAPLGLLFGGLAGRASMLASDLEADKLAMRILVGDAAKSDALIQKIRANAAATPFETGELISSSKRLLRLTGDNTDQNLELLKVMETMAALDPTKTVIDATEALLDATSGGGFERLKEFGIAFRAEDFAAAGRPGGKAWGEAVIAGLTGEIKRRTRGEDLVGALSQTTKGLLSTLSDAINVPLTESGDELNQRGRKWIVSLTNGITAAAPMIRDAVGDLFGDFEDLLGIAGPVVKQIRGWWDGLGEDGQRRVVKVAVAVGMAAAALVALAAPLGVIGLLASGVFSMFSGLGEIVLAVAPAALEFFATLPGLLALVSAGMAGATTSTSGLWSGVMAVVGVFKWWFGVLGSIWTGAVQPFLGGFMDGLAGIGAEVSGIAGGPLSDLWTAIADLFAMVLPQTDDAKNSFRQWGRAIGTIVGYVIRFMAGLIRTVAAFIGGVIEMTAPLVNALVMVTGAIAGWITGSKTAGEAATDFFGGVIGFIAGIGTALVSALTVVLETVYNLVGSLLAAIPGVGQSMSKALFAKADAVGQFRRDMQRQLVETMDKSSSAAAARDAAKSDATSAETSAAVSDLPIDIEVYPTSTVEIDGKELAKAGGRQAVRSGERGTGPKLPEEQRARVLRRGLEVTPLRPAEVG